MAHDDHIPEIIRHTVGVGRTQFPMYPDMYEAYVVTTTYPTKDFVGQVLSRPCFAPDQHEHYQRGFVYSLPLDPEAAAVVANNVAAIMLTRADYLAEFLNTRVLFWNCTGICLCKYRETISSLRAGGTIDVVVILGGSVESDATVSFWTDLGLNGSVISNFGGHGPSVTVKWDDTLVDVVVSEALVDHDTRKLEVRVNRLHFSEAIENAFRVVELPNGHLSDDGSSSKEDE